MTRMANFEEIRECVAKIDIAPSIEASRSLCWYPKDGLLIAFLRTVIIHQHECLSVMVCPETKQFAHLFVPFVRTACEELIWAKYLISLDREVAEALVQYLSSRNLFESLSAQKEYSADSIRSLGLEEAFEACLRNQENVRRSLAEIAKRLKWKDRSGKRVPSIKYIAKEVGLQKLYILIYHASSRFVHFSPHELMRRIWGKPGDMHISSSHFSKYWACFGVYWALRIYLDLLESLNSILGVISAEGTSSLDEDAAILDAASKLGELGAIPIITAEELAWPFPHN
jgi:hypothetical protein